MIGIVSPLILYELYLYIDAHYIYWYSESHILMDLQCCQVTEAII
jgi:hypothetical protein